MKDVMEHNSNKCFGGRDGILSLFSREELEDIQNKISKVTGLAFVTVDYKGEPVTEKTEFTEFCRCVRSNPAAEKICMSSDAYGSIQAAVTCKTHVYLCPCGLLEIAIPIIVDGQYLGGFVGGQIRCKGEPPAFLNRLSNVMHHTDGLLDSQEIINLFGKIKQMTYEEFISASDLVSLVITQLAEKEASKNAERNLMDNRMDILNKQKELMEIENDLKDAKLRALQAQMSPHFLYNCLSSISNLAIIEGAEKTNEMAVLFAEYLRDNIKNVKDSLTVKEEMANIENYLRIQKIRFGERLDYEINFDSRIGNQNIPYHIVMPFVENSIIYGITPKEEGGKIEIEIFYDKDDVAIIIEDNGYGMNHKKIVDIYNSKGIYYDSSSLCIGISNTRKRLVTLFGENYDIVIQSKINKGTKTIIKYPRNYNEEIE